mgnify:CR=1 FL=1
MLKITKFGGSSVANAEQFKKIKAIKIQHADTLLYRLLENVLRPTIKSQICFTC